MKRIGWILLSLVLLVLLLILLIYLPPVQNYAQRKGLEYISGITDMDITMERLRLRFPLNLVGENVRVVQESDTLLSVERFGLKLKLIPLIKGNIEADGIFLENGSVNTGNLIAGTTIIGSLDDLRLEAHTIQLSTQVIPLQDASLTGASFDIFIQPVDTIPEDTVQSANNWVITLDRLNAENIAVRLEMPNDSMYVSTDINNIEVHDVIADLGIQRYALNRFTLSGNHVDYNRGLAPPAPGFDPSHIQLTGIQMDIDSIDYHGMNISAGIRNLQLTERSGLQINSANGRIFSDGELISIPQLNLFTPNSSVDFRAQTRWDSINNTIEDLEARLNLSVGKEDIMIFAGNLSPNFRQSYPESPLQAQLIASGNLNNIRLTRLAAELPGIFTLNGQGEINNVTDSLNRSGNVFMNVQTGRLDFLKELAGMRGDTTIIIPRGMRLTADMNVRGSVFDADVLLREGNGRVQVRGNFNTVSQAYQANLSIDSLQLNHFLRVDTLGKLVANAQIEGRGLDFTSPASTANLNMAVDLLEFRQYDITGITLVGELRNATATGTLNSDNELLIMEAWGEYALGLNYTQARASVNVTDVDIYRLGIINSRMRNNLSLSLSAVIESDTSTVYLYAGDLQARLRAAGTLSEIISESTEFAGVLTTQINERQLDHIELRRTMPRTSLSVTAGRENPVSRYLARRNISFSDLRAGFITNPERGLNGGASIHTLKADTFQLDTVYVVAFQDTARLNLRAGITNGPSNPHATFDVSVTGEVRTQDAEVMIRYMNAQGQTGVLLGANVTPNVDGVQINFIPEQPIFAYRAFTFNENSVFIRNNGRVLADLEMLDADGMGLRVHSLPDTTYLQNLDIELRRINLSGISNLLPYYPSFGGIFSLEAVFRQTEENMTVSAEGTINDLVFQDNLVGNIGLGATWLPGDGGMHYIDGYLSLEGREVLVASGSYQSSGESNINANATLEHLPLYVVNAFVPNEIIALGGDLDGNLSVTGTLEAPQVNGELRLDSVTVNSTQYGISFALDNRPLQINNSRITFDQFAIYSSDNTDNPFTIEGFVDFANLSNPNADLTLSATNYRLLDAPRRDGNLLYGRIFIDLNSTIQGPLSDLVMRGEINVLGNTNANYVLTDSPLTVQDRLGDLVVFTSFSDTLSQQRDEPQVSSVTGIDIALTINIDQAVQLGVDLSADRSSYIDIEGGGNLSFQYTQLGDMVLSGRYSILSGTFKYSLPVIPLKEFAITPDSYVEWSGDVMNPTVNVKATERVNAAVANTDGTRRTVGFDVSIQVLNSLNNLDIVFDLAAPEDGEVQQQLQAMAPEEKNKQAVALMATGVFLAGGATGGSGDFELGAALNNLIQGQLASLAGSALEAVNISFGLENYDDATGQSRTAYNFKYSQRFFNDRVQVIIGGSITTDENMGQTESLIDNVSLEYRLDRSGTRFIRLYHDRNYENILEGEVVETGVGLILRRKVNRLGELFIFRKNR